MNLESCGSRKNIPKETNTKTTLGEFSFYGHCKSTEEDSKKQELKQFEVGSCSTEYKMDTKISQSKEAKIAKNENKDFIASFRSLNLKESSQDHNKSSFNYKNVFNKPGDCEPVMPAFLTIPQKCADTNQISSKQLSTKSLQKPIENTPKTHNTSYTGLKECTSSQNEEDKALVLHEKYTASTVMQLAGKPNKAEHDLVSSLKRTILNQQHELVKKDEICKKQQHELLKKELELVKKDEICKNQQYELVKKDVICMKQQNELTKVNNVIGDFNSVCLLY